MCKFKTSIFIDEEIWRRFKKYVSSRDRELSEVLEELIREELMLDLENIVKEIAGELIFEVDFEPIKTETLVSSFVREMRNERESSVFRGP